MVRNRAFLIIISVLIILFGIMKPWTAMAETAIKVGDLNINVTDLSAATAQDGMIYVFGGADGIARRNEIMQYNPASNTCSVVGSLPQNAVGAAAVTAPDGKIYVIGGTLNNTYIVKFDPTTYSAANVVELNEPISGISATLAFNGKIYFIDSSGIYQFDPDSLDVTLVANLPTPRGSACAATAQDGMIYIFGGDLAGDINNNVGEPIGDILQFNPLSYSVTKVSDLPYVQAKACAVTSSNGQIYLIGNYDRTNWTDILEFDPVTKTTVIVGSLPSGRYDSAATSLDDKIYIVGGNGFSNYLKEVLLFTPGLPTFRMTATLQNDSDAFISWTNAGSGFAYILEKSVDGNNFTKISEGGNTFTETGLAPGTYYYRVSASNGSGTSVQSNVVSVTVQLSPPILSAALEDNNVNLTWAASTGATNYIIETSVDGTSFNALTQTNYTTHNELNLAPGTYYYRVSASNANGTSAPSNIVSVTVQPPPSPTFLVYWPTGGQYVEVNWNGNNTELSGDMVQLWRQDTISSVWLNVKSISCAEKDSFIWLDTNVTSGINYKYQVRVYEPATWSWCIAAESDWATGDKPYKAPGGLRVTSSTDTTALVTWVPVSGATTYQVQVSTDGGSSWQKSTVESPSVTVPRPCRVRVKAGGHVRSQWSGILRVNN